MTTNRWPYKPPPIKADNAHQCEAGYCRERACVDYGTHRRFPGFPDEVRYLCHQHAGRHDEIHAA